MAIFKCKMCGGTLEINNNETVAVCEYCGTKQTLPKLDDEKRVQLYDRANHFRRENEFDKAMGIYEMILSDDKEDCESYWGIVLCRYGIEYVEDPRTHKRIPTVNRAQFTSIFDDEDYKNAIKYADGYQKDVYEAEATVIDKIQKGILEISNKEEPFDVFICYKETDKNGNRTQDSVYAQDIYTALTKEGYKVFFSRITLEDKLGSAYEPYIFAALNSAKVMLVIGTEKDNFNAVWVKNEWSRYLSLIKAGKDKNLIPVYKDIAPYDMPEEFQYLQSQDMAKIGFMQDLVRGISKLVDSNKTTVKETVVVNGANTNVAPLLERAFIFLEDGDWNSADEYCEKVLDIDPKNAQAYLGKLMAELRVDKQENLVNCSSPFNNSANYEKVLRYGQESLKTELAGYIEDINVRNKAAHLEKLYNEAKSSMNMAKSEEEYKKAARKFEAISTYKDSESLMEYCLEKAEISRKDAILEHAKSKMLGDDISNYESAIVLFESIPDWKDSQEKILICKQKIEEIKVKEETKIIAEQKAAEERRIAAEKAKKESQKRVVIAIVITCLVIVFGIIFATVIVPAIDEKKADSKYSKAIDLMNNGYYEDAISYFEELNGFKDSSTKITECENLIIDNKYCKAVSLANEKKYIEAINMFFEISSYKDSEDYLRSLFPKITLRETVSADLYNTVAIRTDGTVVSTKIIEDLSGWASYSKDDGQCNVSDWNNIVAISTNSCHTVGLKSDGTVVAVGDLAYGRGKVNDWTDIVAISAGFYHTFGLKLDGTVVSTECWTDNCKGECRVNGWTDIIAISASVYHTVGLKSDGTVVVAGGNYGNHWGQCNVSDWTDIVAVSAGGSHTVGLKSDGTVVAVGNNDKGQCDVSGWTDVVAISAGAARTIALKSDGTVVAVGDNEYGRCNVSGWSDIIAISVGAEHTVGLKSNGTIVSVGNNEYGQCNVKSWKNIKKPSK